MTTAATAASHPAATAIIVAHGSPSDPDTLEARTREVAGRVAALCPELPVIGTTLAKKGALEAALECASATERIIVYPFFMSSGWFVEKELRRRIAQATDRRIDYAEPFGLDPLLPPLCVKLARDALMARGWAPETATVVLAAHGSGSGSRAPSRAARTVSGAMRRIGGLGEVRIGYVEQAPSIAEAAAGIGTSPAVCLPLFALTAGHVIGDIPEELGKVDFAGPVLRPVGEDDAAPAVIAQSLRTHLASLVTAA